MARRTRLEEGTFLHPPCPSCSSEPGVKTKVDTDKRWVTRLRFCEAEGGALVDFSVVLQIARPEKWRDVARWSVAHANFHVYRYSWRGGRKGCHSYGPVNGVNEVARAYRQTTQDAYPRIEALIDEWWEGSHG